MTHMLSKLYPLPVAWAAASSTAIVQGFRVIPAATAGVMRMLL
jgi:hypothetical protein